MRHGSSWASMTEVVRKKAKVDTETIQTLYVHIAVLMFTLAISLNTYQQEVLLE